MAATKGSGSVSPGVLKPKLFRAAKSGDVKAARDALDGGVEVDALNANKWTALHEACRYGQLEVVRLLLAAGADPNVAHSQNGFTPMVVAAFEVGHAEILRALVDGGAAPSLASSSGRTVLHWVAEAGDVDALEVLLQAGGDPHVQVGTPPQTLAERAKDPAKKELVEALVAKYSGVPKQSIEEASRVALRTRKPVATAPHTESPPLDLAKLRVKGERQPVPEAALERLKAETATSLPDGYREMMQTLGPGTLGTKVRVQGPETILRNAKAWRERVAQYWFWGAGPLLSQDAAQGAFVVADTIDGDELVFLPADPNTLLLLPREDEEVMLVSKTGLLPALTRLVTSESGRVPAKLVYEPVREGQVTSSGT
jgi:hypothetical protein